MWSTGHVTPGAWQDQSTVCLELAALSSQAFTAAGSSTSVPSCLHGPAKGWLLLPSSWHRPDSRLGFSNSDIWGGNKGVWNLCCCEIEVCLGVGTLSASGAMGPSD